MKHFEYRALVNAPFKSLYYPPNDLILMEPGNNGESIIPFYFPRISLMAKCAHPSSLPPYAASQPG